LGRLQHALYSVPAELLLDSQGACAGRATSLADHHVGSLDEFHQSRACGIARSHFDAGVFRERSVDVVKRVLHGGSGKDGNTFVLARCEVSPEDCEKCENDCGEPANPAHSVLPKRFTTRMSARSDRQSFW